MNTMLLTGLLLTTAPAHATFDIKPGLWQVQMKMTLDGKAFEPMAEVKKALEKLSPEQRKQMEAMMAGNSQMPIAKDGYRVCYTKEMLKNPGKVMEGTQSCTTKITTQTSKKIAGSFDCPKEDAKGTFEWNAKSDSAYEGLMTGKTSKGKDTVIRYSGKFISADCGKVKPVL